jgi:hypothetical protein
MNIPEHVYRYFYSLADGQENIEFDANGNEIYHGIAPNSAATTDASWVIAKGVYTQDPILTTVYRLTHVSFLRGQIWANRASITFP